LNIPDGARGHINRQPQIRVFGQIVKSVPKALTLNKVQAQLGTRWFDLFPNSDFAGEIGYEREQLLFAAQLEHNFGLSDWSIGATVNSTTRQASIIFGIKFDVGKKAEVFTSTPKILQSSETIVSRLLGDPLCHLFGGKMSRSLKNHSSNNINN
jgi:hypothetical protein